MIFGGDKKHGRDIARTGLFLVCAGISLWIRPAFSANMSTPQGEDSDEKCRSEVVRFFDKCFGTGGEVITSMAALEKCPGKSGLVTYEVNNMSLVDVHMKDCKITSYRPTALFRNPNCEDTGKTSGISETEAFSRAKPFLSFFGQPLEPTAYRIRQMRLGGNKTDSLWGCLWSISRDLSLDGVPCRGSRFVIQLEACGGDIACITNLPPIRPTVKPDKPIGRSDAVGAVRSWVAGREELKNGFEMPAEVAEGIQMVIVTSDEARSSPDNYGAETYYCWEVPFSSLYYGNRKKSVAWVNLETGNVINWK